MNKVKIIACASIVIAMSFVYGCSSKSDEKFLMSALFNDRDEDEIHGVIEYRKISLDGVLDILWIHLNSNNTKSKEVSDNAFVKISRGVLMSPISFDMNDDDYWNGVAEFYISKYNVKSDEKMRRAAAIYLRQIRRPEVELLANKAGVPSLKELTGVELEGDRL